MYPKMHASSFSHSFFVAPYHYPPLRPLISPPAPPFTTPPPFIPLLSGGGGETHEAIGLLHPTKNETCAALRYDLVVIECDRITCDVIVCDSFDVM